MIQVETRVFGCAASQPSHPSQPSNPCVLLRSGEDLSVSSPLPVRATCARASLPPFFAHMASFVRITLAGAGSFAEVNIVEGDTISRLADRACVKFSHWGVNAGQISLYLEAAGGDDLPPPSAVDSARHLDQIGWSLSRAGISSGAWLVARKIADDGASFSCSARACPIMHTASLRL